MSKSNGNHIPKHVGIIMDGNRRWARAHGLQILLGHKKAAENVIEPIIEKAANLGIPFLTFWCFSTENWRRDESEIRGLMNVFRYVLETKLQRFKERGAKVRILGDLSKFPRDIQDKVKRAMEETSGNTAITVNFAMNYGGREEILRAINKLLAKCKVQSAKCRVEEEEFDNYLDTAGEPDPDLIIRTGGEQRLSGFLPWQSVYSELYFTKVYFPDFSPAEFEKALDEYTKRQRRFGR